MKNTKEVKKLKIEARGSVNRSDVENGLTGECHVVMNMRECNKALHTVGKWKVLGQVSTNEKMLLVDTRNGIDYYLTSRGNDIYLHGMKRGGEYEQCNEKLCSLESEPVWAQSVGRFVVISTQYGCRYLYFKDSAYCLLDIEDVIPQLKLEAANGSSIEETIVGKKFKNGYTQWSKLKTDDKSQLTASVLSAYDNVLKKAKQRGVFVQPVVARYALKLWDDSYAWVSAPVIVGRGVQLRGMVSAEVDSGLLTYSDSELRADVYNIGVKMLKKPSVDWLPLIKSIDVLVGEELSPYTLDDIDCKCETDTDLTRYLSYSLIEKNRESYTMEVINPQKWHVIASLTNFDELLNQTHVLWRNDVMPMVKREEIARLTAAINHEMVANAGLSINGRLYTGGQTKIMRNAWKSVQSWGSARVNIPCEVIVAVKLDTIQGEAVKVTRETYDDTPELLNRLIAYPDIRAKEITIKILSNDEIKQWTGKLTAVANQGFACFVSEDFKEIEFEPSVSFYEPTEQNIIEQVSSELTVYRNGNPFVKEQVRAVWQGEILDISLVPKTVYSSVFGRYPVYVFTTRGIYAVAYKEMGDYKDVQLIDTRRLNRNCSVATSRDKVYFVSDDDELCMISGKNVSVISSVSGVVTQLIWLKLYGELLERNSDGSIQIEMIVGRKYHRDIKLLNVYGDLYNALAITTEGNLVDLNEEIIDTIDAIFETHPILVENNSLIAPMRLCVNVTGNEVVKGKVNLLGSDGAMCDWRVLETIELSGKVCHPVISRIYAKPCRLLKLQLDVTCKSDLLFRNVILDYN